MDEEETPSYDDLIVKVMSLESALFGIVCERNETQTCVDILETNRDCIFCEIDALKVDIASTESENDKLKFALRTLTLGFAKSEGRLDDLSGELECLFRG